MIYELSNDGDLAGYVFDGFGFKCQSIKIQRFMAG